ncbi:MAG: hypothetical protein QXT05_02565 [Candidatus Bilamarchaeaceae archaeon]
MFAFIPHILSFVSGFLVKWVDWIEDERKGESPLKYPLAVVYGILIGYIISAAPFAEIFLGALVAQVFARKIDTASHALGFFIAALSLSVFGFPQISLALFFYFLVLAFLDEMKFAGRLAFVSEHRLFLPVGSLVMLLFGRWEYTLGILFFDAGYLLFGKLSGKYLK